MSGDGNSVAYHGMSDDRIVAGSQYGIGQQLPTPDGHTATVADIKSVWEGDRNIGWVYTDQDHKQYFQQNRAVDPTSSWSVGIAKFVEVGRNSPTGPGDVQPLDDHRPLQDQLPHGAQVLDGFRRNSSDRDDARTATGAPMSIGDEIPNGHGGSTSIAAVNSIMFKQTNTGWEYKGADGHHYFQRRTDTEAQTTIGGGLGVVSAGAGPAQYSGVHPFHIGDLQAGEHLLPMTPKSPHLEGENLGYQANGTTTLPNGGQLTGTVVAVTQDHVLQQAGRGAIAVHDRAALPQDVAAGNLVTISNQNGTLAVTDPQQQERGLGRVS